MSVQTVPDTHNLKKESFIVAHVFRGFSSWWAAYKAEVGLVKEHGRGRTVNLSQAAGKQGETRGALNKTTQIQVIFPITQSTNPTQN